MTSVRKILNAKIEAAQAEETQVEYDKLSDLVYCDLFAHSDQLTERMNFIKDFAKYGSFQFAYEHLTLLWHELIEDNVMSSDHR